jgi:hypothetical protein
MEREINLSKSTDQELTDEELNGITGSGVWEAFVCFLQGGTDASHVHTRREGGGPRGG